MDGAVKHGIAESTASTLAEEIGDGVKELIEPFVHVLCGQVVPSCLDQRRLAYEISCGALRRKDLARKSGR